MSECLSWKEKINKSSLSHGEKPCSRRHLCIKMFPTSLSDCDPTDGSLKRERREAPKPSIV